MKKVFRIGALIVIVVFIVLLFTGCVEGFVDDEQYNELISGIIATNKENESCFYGNEILQNNIEFDTQIEYDEYCKFEIRKVKSCKVRGIVFVVRSLETVNLKFTVFANDVQLYTKEKQIISNTTTDVDLFFEPFYLNQNDELYIEVEQLKEIKEGEDEESIKFKFDGFMVAFAE